LCSHAIIVLDIRDGVKHNINMKQKAPTNALTLTGAPIRTAEAARVLNSSIRLLAVELKRRFHDLPFLPDRNRQSWTRKEWRSAPQMPTMR
jgi:hypothetical protein